MNKYGIPDSSKNARVTVIQPKTKNNFYLEFDIKDLGSDTGNVIQFANNIVSCEAPRAEYSEIAINKLWTQGFVYGRPRWNPINIVVRDDIKNVSMTMLGLLIQRQTNTFVPTNTPSSNTVSAGNPDLATFGYTSYFDLVIKNVSGQYDNANMDEWHLGKCFITNVEYGAMSYESDTEVQTISFTIRFNTIKQTLSNHPIYADKSLRSAKLPLESPPVAEAGTNDSVTPVASDDIVEAPKVEEKSMFSKYTDKAMDMAGDKLVGAVRGLV